MKLKAIADKIATDIYHRPIDPWMPRDAVIRDACDLATASDLPVSAIDRLHDMVDRRLKDPYRYGLR